MNLTPAASVAAIMASLAARVSSIGFSQKTCLPAAAAAMVTSRCEGVGVATITAPMSARASTSR
jgi:hypothetical protein